jgi:hypothetical protein
VGGRGVSEQPPPRRYKQSNHQPSPCRQEVASGAALPVQEQRPSRPPDGDPSRSDDDGDDRRGRRGPSRRALSGSRSRDDERHSRQDNALRVVERQRHRKDLDPGKYDGSLPLETFLAQFDNAAFFNQYTEDEKTSVLKNCLKALANQILWDKGTSTIWALILD